MSVESCRRQIESTNRELGQLHQKLADERKREADKTARIGQVERSITRSTSASSVQGKAREIQRLNKDIEQSKKKQADLTKQIAAKEKKKHQHERDLLKEQGKQQQAHQKDQDRRMAQFEANLHRSMTKATSPSLPRAHSSTAKEHDVFISHASEDKESFVRALAEGLCARGVNVWYDEFELRVGDSLRRSIDRGLANSRFGIVVLSSAFFAKNWPQYELDGLVTKETSSGGKVILPVWHKVSKDEVASYSPTLADKVALNTGIQSLDEIIEELVGVIRPAGSPQTEDGDANVSTVPPFQEQEHTS
jgi:hypothetical protein